MSIFRKLISAPARFEGYIDSFSEEQVDDFIDLVSWALVGFTALLLVAVVIVVPVLRCEGVIQ